MGGAKSKPQGFHFGSTTSEVMAVHGERARGKHVIVTGGNCGLGLETARALAEFGAAVTLACRSEKLGQEAVQTIKKAHPEAKVEFLKLDLASLRSVRAAAQQYLDSKQPLHVLINNAGVMAQGKRQLTEDGFEQQFGINHLGHFLFTVLLLPALEATGTADTPARVINLSSLAQRAFAPPEGIKINDLDATKSYDPWERYGQSKLANVLFSSELNERCAAAGKHVISVSLHPGAIASTNLGRHVGVGVAYSLVKNMLFGGTPGSFNVFVKERFKTIPQGSSTSVLTALVPDVVPGAYYADCNVSQVLHVKATDVALRRQLWEESVRLTGLAAPAAAAASQAGGETATTANP